MGWQDLFVGQQPGLSDQDRQGIAKGGLLQAGLQALAANNSRNVTPGAALAGGLLGGIQSAQQGARQLQDDRFQQQRQDFMQSQMQDQQDQMQRRRNIQDLALKFVKPDGTFDQPGYQQALYGIDPEAAIQIQHNTLQAQAQQLGIQKAQDSLNNRDIQRNGMNVHQIRNGPDDAWRDEFSSPTWKPDSGSSGQLTSLERNLKLLMSQGIPKNQALASLGITVPSEMDSMSGPPVSGKEFLSQLPATAATQVQALADGRMAFPTGTALKSPYWQDMLQKVAQYDPSFDAVNYNARAATRKAFTSGKEAQTVNSLNTVAEHLGQLSDAAQNLKNTTFQPWNRIKNWAADQTGDPNISTFNTTAKAAADEVAKVWRASGGSEADIQENLKNLSSAQSTAQLNAAIGTLTHLIGGKISALQDQYAQGMGTAQQIKPLVSPEANRAFQKTLQRQGQAIQLPPANQSSGGWSAKRIE